MTTPLPELSLIETRVLGVLAEKQRTVPDTYPMTVNALVSGCNQKTSRNPVIEATPGDVQAALNTLSGLGLAMETSGGRGVARYAHNLAGVLGIPSQSAALITVLMLRGPQTAGELRMACDRLHHFADISSVEVFLEELATRPAGTLVVELARQPGSRENRWAHTLSGTPVLEIQAIQTSSGGEAAPVEVAALKADVARLEAEVDALKSVVGRICTQIGISPH